MTAFSLVLGKRMGHSAPGIPTAEREARAGV